MTQMIQKAIQVVPSPKQLAWQQVEFFGFIHFGMNTMTDSEWGNGQDSPQCFNPTQLDAHQWVKTFKQAGMKGAILTCKHHDGFCLWPSKYTDYSVKSSPWQNGKGDVVKAFADACQLENIKFGIYLSPWDRHEAAYGQGELYDDYFVHQLEELLTHYGDVFEVWFDGANGEGPNGKVQHYNWQRYYDTIHRLQPNAVIAISGPDVRWVGNEAGKTRQNEWSVVPSQYANPNKVAEDSQKEAQTEIVCYDDPQQEDLGSREVLQHYTGDLIWYPAEVDVSIRPGWFYHASQNQDVKNAATLFTIYKGAVGGNCALILNVPPNKSGRFDEEDVMQLTALGERIEYYRERSAIMPQHMCVSSGVLDQSNLFMLDQHDLSYISDEQDDMPTITLTFERPVLLNYVDIREFIEKSQRIEHGKIIVNQEIVAEFGTVGYHKLIEFDSVRTQSLQIIIDAYRGAQLYLSTIRVGYL